MTSDPRQVTEADLLAFADGRLAADRSGEIENHLAAHPRQAEEVAAWKRQNAALNALYAHVADEPVPARLNPHSIALRGRRAAWAGRLRMAAAALVLLAVGAGAGWYGHGRLAPPPKPTVSLVSEATDAHRLYSSEVVHPVEVGADQRAHLVTWLSRRLDRHLTAPDLTANGFTLLGGRLLPTDKGAAAQFMYQDAGGHRITLYIVPARGTEDSPLWFAHRDGLETVYWWHKTIDCAVVGSQTPDTMKALAKAAYEQLG